MQNNNLKDHQRNIQTTFSRLIFTMSSWLNKIINKQRLKKNALINCLLLMFSVQLNLTSRSIKSISSNENEMNFFIFWVVFVQFCSAAVGVCVSLLGCRNESLWKCFGIGQIWANQIFNTESYASWWGKLVALGVKSRMSSENLLELWRRAASLSFEPLSERDYNTLGWRSPTFKSLKNIVFLAQSTCENKFWSNTLHINSKRSTSHWLYVWLCSSENSEDCHSRSSTVCTNSRIIGETLFGAREKGLKSILKVKCGTSSRRLTLKFLTNC